MEYTELLKEYYKAGGNDYAHIELYNDGSGVFYPKAGGEWEFDFKDFEEFKKRITRKIDSMS